MDTDSTLKAITNAALDLKALDLKEYDLRGFSSLNEYVLICHGTSTAHTRGIADKISLELKKEKVLPLGVEGYNEGEWILMDYNSVVVHIFQEKIRTLYDLESLFEDLHSTTAE